MKGLGKGAGIVGLLVAALGVSADAQAPSMKGSSVVRLDPALDEIISTNAKVEVLKEDYFGFAEGAAWMQDGGSGYLLFSDMAANKVYKWTAAQGFSIFVDPAGFTGTAGQFGGSVLGPPNPPPSLLYNGRLWVSMYGSNGLTLDREGRLILCTHGDRNLVRIEKDGKRTVLADKYEGKRLNGPNDVVVKSDGSIYFTDRGSGLYGMANSPHRELPYIALMRWKDGKVEIMNNEPGLGQMANGLAFSPDESILYTAQVGTGPGAGQIMKWDVRPDGTITNPRVFIDTSLDKASGPGGPDGIRVDKNGNLWTGGPGGVWIVSPQGKLLGKILVRATNMTFGDPDWKGLYTVAMSSVYHVRLNTPAR